MHASLSTTTLIYKTGHLGFAKPSFKLKNVTEIGIQRVCSAADKPHKEGTQKISGT